MTNYNERLDDILEDLGDYHEHLYDNMWLASNGEYTKDEAKQALTSLIKELVTEVKPDRSRIEYVYDRGFNDSVLIYEQNLLKALEEK